MRPGDCIVSVNGTSGDIEEMLRCFQEVEVLHFEVRRPRHLILALPSDRGPLGLRVVFATSGATLLVTDILDGRIIAFNRSNVFGHEDREVRIGDRILRVNGETADEKEGPSSLIEVMSGSGSMVMEILRLV